MKDFFRKLKCFKVRIVILLFCFFDSDIICCKFYIFFRIKIILLLYFINLCLVLVYIRNYLYVKIIYFLCLRKY